MARRAPAGSGPDPVTASLPFAGKVAVVTGGAHGIGRATALRLARDGAAVAILDIDGPAAATVANGLRTDGSTVQAWTIDCTDPAAVPGAFAQVRAAFGPIDILVNNVGQSSRQRMAEFSGDTLARLEFMLTVNLRSCVLCTDAVVPGMRDRRGGRIVNVTSEAAFNGAPRNWDYAAAKSSITGFTRAMARELAPFGVTVNAVAPGATRTRAMEAMPQDLLAQIVARIPMGRMGEPEEVADVIAFFAGRQSSYVTGQTLLVNGGNWFL